MGNLNDYCGTIAPSGRILAPLKAGKKTISAEAAPLIFIKGNRKNQSNMDSNHKLILSVYVLLGITYKYFT